MNTSKARERGERARTAWPSLTKVLELSARSLTASIVSCLRAQSDGERARETRSQVGRRLASQRRVQRQGWQISTQEMQSRLASCQTCTSRTSRPTTRSTSPFSLSLARPRLTVSTSRAAMNSATTSPNICA